MNTTQDRETHRHYGYTRTSMNFT